MNRFISQPILIILVYLKCYETINPKPDNTLEVTYFITNTPWVHNFVGRWQEPNNAAIDTGIIYKPKNLNKPNVVPVSTVTNTQDGRKDFNKAFDSQTILKYEYKPKELEHESANEILAAKTLVNNKLWSEYVHSSNNNYRRFGADDTSPPIYNINFNQREPTRTPYTMYPQRPVLVITRTNSPKDLIEHQNNRRSFQNNEGKYENNQGIHQNIDGTFDNVWSKIDIPARYVKNWEHPVKNVAKISSLEKERALASWREFDIKERDKILKARREPIHEVLHRVPF